MRRKIERPRRATSLIGAYYWGPNNGDSHETTNINHCYCAFSQSRFRL